MSAISEMTVDGKPHVSGELSVLVEGLISWAHDHYVYQYQYTASGRRARWGVDTYGIISYQGRCQKDDNVVQQRHILSHACRAAPVDWITREKGEARKDGCCRPSVLLLTWRA